MYSCSRYQQAGIAHTAASGGSSASTSSSIAPKAKTTAINKNDKFANYSTAASLGFVDGDAILAEQEKLAREARAKIGEAGAWETVAVIDPSHDEEATQDGEEDARYAFNGGDVKPSTSGILRGSLDDDPGEEARNFRFEQDRGAGDGPARRVKPDVYDDGEWDSDSILALGRKGKQAVKSEGDVKTEVKPETGEVTHGNEGVAGGASQSADTAEADRAKADIKKEDDAAESKPSGSGMFKKRKAPGAANRSVRQKM